MPKKIDTKKRLIQAMESTFIDFPANDAEHGYNYGLMISLYLVRRFDEQEGE